MKLDLEHDDPCLPLLHHVFMMLMLYSADLSQITSVETKMHLYSDIYTVISS